MEQVTPEAIIREELERLRSGIIARSQQQGQKASGRTYAAIQTEDVSDKGGKLVGSSYVAVLATGRRSGKVPYDFVRIIKEWAAYKGITFSDEREFDRWANAVAWKIRREGTELWRTVGSSGGGLDVFQTPIEDCIKRISERLAVFYTVEISNQIQEIWQ